MRRILSPLHITLISLVLTLAFVTGCTPTDDYRLATGEDGLNYVISQRPIGDQDALIAQLKQQTTTLKIYPFATTVTHDVPSDISIFIRNNLAASQLFSLTLACADNAGTPEDFNIKDVHARLDAGDVGHIPIAINAKITDVGIYDCSIKVHEDTKLYATERLFIQVV